jgi:hypothetical protein
MITTSTYGMSSPRRALPKALTVTATMAATTKAATTIEVATTAGTMVETMATFRLHPMCCRVCRQSIADLYASVDECLQAMEAMKQRMEDLEHVVEDDYKFLNRNVRKLFGMVGNMRSKWCNTCLKYH